MTVLLRWDKRRTDVKPKILVRVHRIIRRRRVVHLAPCPVSIPAGSDLFFREAAAVDTKRGQLSLPGCLCVRVPIVFYAYSRHSCGRGRTGSGQGGQRTGTKVHEKAKSEKRKSMWNEMKEDCGRRRIKINISQHYSFFACSSFLRLPA